MDNPCLGFTFYMLNVVLFCITSLVTKLLYNEYPEINAFQMLFMRATVSSVLYLAIINVNFKKVMIDSVTNETKGPLLYRTA